MRTTHLNSYLFLFLCMGCICLMGQELPPIQNYAPTHYKGENQNWAISQGANKLIYVANNKGLLVFNGASWKLYPARNQTILRSVHVNDDLVYTGSYMDFGFWEKDKFNALHYTSLTKKTGLALVEDEEFWNIISLDQWVLFQSLNRIYIYDTGKKTIEIINSKNKIAKMYRVDSEIYFQRVNDGIFKIVNGKDVLVTGDDQIRNKEIVNIHSNENGLLLQTRNHGLYTFKDQVLEVWRPNLTRLLSGYSVYSSIKLNNNGFVLGTISNGIIFLNAKGDVQLQINKGDGLLNNTVLSLYEDKDANIWLGLDNGISAINMNSPYKVYNDNSGRIGSVYTSAVYKGNLYLGSNQGLFYKNIEGNQAFKFIPGTQGQVWCLKEFDQTLFCGHDSGTFIVEGSRVRKISDHEGAWDIKPMVQDDLLLQGNYDGLYVLQKKGSGWNVKNKIANFSNSARQFEQTSKNEIFVNHEYKGVFKIKVDGLYTKALEVTIDSTKKGANSYLATYNNDLLYSYSQGVFKYDPPSQKFIKDSTLSTLYDGESEFISGKLLRDGRTDNLWSFSKSNINLLSPGQLTNAPKITRIPINAANRDDLVGYENIKAYRDNGLYLLGNYSGYITVNTEKRENKNFEVHIDRISVYNKKVSNDMLLQNKNQDKEFKTDENNFQFSFYVADYNKFLTKEYQYRLSGIYDEWSNWSPKSEALFENLPPGSYIFTVRAKIGNKISTNSPTYTFKIAKPWYASNFMMALYALAVILFSIFMHNLYKRYYKRQQKKLIVQNKRELELVNVQNEKEIIRIKNERLQEEFKSKSKELAASTMSIVRKNEILTTIKKELNGISDKKTIKPVLEIIDKSLRKNDDWEFFKEAFNNADSEFLQKIKNQHPKLSPNDLKLCAYLRLNLSSKEIAPLLNISPRSVEIKRYRLRKKLNLSHEDNLANYIIAL